MVREVTIHWNQCLLHCRMLSVYFTLQDTIMLKHNLLAPLVHVDIVQKDPLQHNSLM